MAHSSDPAVCRLAYAAQDLVRRLQVLDGVPADQRGSPWYFCAAEAVELNVCLKEAGFTPFVRPGHDVHDRDLPVPPVTTP